MTLKTTLLNKFIRGRKPLSIAGDVFFFAFLLMLLIPSTRSLILSGVASVKSWFISAELPEEKKTDLPAEGWNWSLTDMQGRVIPFSSFRGEVIFLNQWATWCPPCRAEMPSIEKLYRRFGESVKFIILTNEEPPKVIEYLKKEGYTFPVYFGSVAGADLSTRSIPATAIISRTGRIEVNRKGTYNWNSPRIARLLTNLNH